MNLYEQSKIHVAAGGYGCLGMVTSGFGWLLMVSLVVGWVDIKLCQWVPKVPFVLRRIDFTIVYFYLEYEK